MDDRIVPSAVLSLLKVSWVVLFVNTVQLRVKARPYLMVHGEIIQKCIIYLNPTVEISVMMVRTGVETRCDISCSPRCSTNSLMIDFWISNYTPRQFQITCTTTFIQDHAKLCIFRAQMMNKTVYFTQI